MTRKLIALLFVVWLPNFSLGQIIKGNISIKGHTAFGVSASASSNFFAALPIVWVNSGLTTGTGFCPTSGFAATKTMKSSGGDYTPTFAQLIQAKNDQIAANQNWLLKIDAGLDIHGSSFDSNNALVSMPIQTGGHTTCLVVQSSTHNTDGVIVCSHGLPGFGGARNPGCTNDISKMWHLTLDSTPRTGNTALLLPVGPGYTIIEDADIRIKAGSAQALPGVDVSILAELDGSYIGIAYDYIHGWDPGDAGQPAGACTLWNRSTVVNTSGTTVTLQSGDYFGLDFSDGTHSPGYPQATVNINGSFYTITNHDPAVSNIVLTVTPSAGTQSGVTMTMTNPATAYANGCGDDSRGIQLNCDYCFAEFNYMEKIHWTNGESHAIAVGFSNGPYKIAHNYFEGGTEVYFSGGGPVDQRGGPASDAEVRGNYFGHDLEQRTLTAQAAKSPAPPWGCGPLDGNAAHDTCPFLWDLKNAVEAKLGHRLVFDGNIIENSWASGQSGYLMLQNVRVCSGGEICGIYDPVTGLPKTAIDNVRVSNNWFRNGPQVFQISPRSLGAGNGGGMSQPIRDLDYINNLFSNIGDGEQWGNPGNDLFQLGGSGANTFLCNMTGTGTVAHAVCLPIKAANYDNSTPGLLSGTAVVVSSVIRSGGVVTMKFDGDRHDPVVGGSIVITNASGWNGTFPITDIFAGTSNTRCTQDLNGNTVDPTIAVAPQPCVRNDGTFGDTIVYSDNQGADGTFCSGVGTGAGQCGKSGAQILTLVMPTHAFQITDISVGDNVYAHDCSVSAYNAGATSAVLAVSPTSPTGLDVYYPSSGTGAATCQIDNTSGFPQNVLFEHNTVLALGIMSANVGNQAKQNYANHFIHNTFAMPSGNGAVITCTPIGGQGTATFVCFDQNTFQFFDNVLQARTSGQWSVVPGGSSPNAFPANVTCSGSTADASCLGYSGYMSGATFPASDCVFDGTNRANCPMMALPWSTNFDLTKISFVGSSVYQQEGVDLTALSNAMTATQYMCPGGAAPTCTPYPD